MVKEILLKEYEVLKSEQLERIKHRDNIIYVLLGAVGSKEDSTMLWIYDYDFNLSGDTKF